MTNHPEGFFELALSVDTFFQELLRLVYRQLFLFTTEDRDLLSDPSASDDAKRIFDEGYSMSSLRERALRKRHYDNHGDLWQALLVTFKGLSRGAPALGLPALGGLFATDQCPNLDKSEIGNAHLLEAIRSLSFFQSGISLARVNYRDMGTEELGSVYESLLELHPKLDVDAIPWHFGFLVRFHWPSVLTEGSCRLLSKCASGSKPDKSEPCCMSRVSSADPPSCACARTRGGQNGNSIRRAAWRRGVCMYWT